MQSVRQSTEILKKRERMVKKLIKMMFCLLNVNALLMKDKLHQMVSTLLEVRKVPHPKVSQVLQLVYSAKQKEIQW